MNNKNIKWYNLDADGFIKDNPNNSLAKAPGIYAYRLKLDNSRSYIGSAINIAQRFRQHRYRCHVSQVKNKYNNLLYNSINKHGWINYEFGTIELVNLPSHNTATQNKKLLLDKEQNYFNKYQPTLNINKIAGSVMGYKHTIINRLNFGSIHRGKSYNKHINPNRHKRAVSLETIIKLKQRVRGVKVGVHDKDLKVVEQFPTIKDAAYFAGLSPSSVSKYINKGVIWNDTYYFKTDLSHVNINANISNNVEAYAHIKEGRFKSHKVEVFDTNDRLIYKYNSLRKASKFLNISRDSLIKYSNNDEVWSNKFKFKIYSCDL